MEQVTLLVKGMSCQHCVKSIKGSLAKLSGVKKVDVNLEEAHVSVEFQSSEVQMEQIKESIESQGYVVCH